MIRIRGVPTRIWFVPLYEVEHAGRRKITRDPVSLLEKKLGIGDAWSFSDAADRQWAAGNRGWAVEFDDHPKGGN